MKLFLLYIFLNDIKIDFMCWCYVVMVVIIVVFLVLVVIIGIKGFNYVLDFIGGILIEVCFDKVVDVEQVCIKFEQSGFEGVQVQSVGGNIDLLICLVLYGEYVLGIGDVVYEDKVMVVVVVKVLFIVDNQVIVFCNEFVGLQIGKDLVMNGLYVIIFMLVGFFIYIVVCFEWKFVVIVSIVVMFDLIVMVVYVFLLGCEFDLIVLVGLLLVMGFVINDIIVVFDCVCENFCSLCVDLMEVLNCLINQMLLCMVIIVVMFFLLVFVLYLYGGSLMEGLVEMYMIGVVIVVLFLILVVVLMLMIGVLCVSKQDLLLKVKDVEVLVCCF